MTIQRIDNETIHPEKNSVFIAFYTEPYHHYQTNEECKTWSENAWDAKISLLGIMKRWDFSNGFVCGKVDNGETLIQAAIRECKEEIDGDIKPEQLTLISTHYCKIYNKLPQHTHFYLCKVTPDEIYDLQQKSVNSIHCKVENSGFAVVHMVEDSFTNLFNSPWAASGKEELEIFLKSHFSENND